MRYFNLELQYSAVRAWFLEIALVGASVYVCVRPEAINNLWHDMV